MPAAALPPTGSARSTRPRMAANTGAVATTRHTLTADVYSSAVYWTQKYVVTAIRASERRQLAAADDEPAPPVADGDGDERQGRQDVPGQGGGHRRQLAQGHLRGHKRPAPQRDDEQERSGVGRGGCSDGGWRPRWRFRRSWLAALCIHRAIVRRGGTGVKGDACAARDKSGV